MIHFKDNTDWQKAYNFIGNNLPYTKEEIDFILEELKEYKPKVLNY